MFGMFVIYTGYPAAFAITGMLMIAALIPAMRDRAAGRNCPADRSRQPSRAIPAIGPRNSPAPSAW